MKIKNVCVLSITPRDKRIVLYHDWFKIKLALFNAIVFNYKTQIDFCKISFKEAEFLRKSTIGEIIDEYLKPNQTNFSV